MKKNTITDEEIMAAYEARLREQEEFERRLDEYIRSLKLDEEDDEDEQEQETKKKRVVRKQVKKWKGTTTPKKRSRKAAAKEDSFLAEVSAA